MVNMTFDFSSKGNYVNLEDHFQWNIKVFSFDNPTLDCS